MPKSIKHLVSACNCERKILSGFRCVSHYSCKDHPSLLPEPRCLHLGAGVQHALTSQGCKEEGEEEEEEEELGIAQVVVVG